MERKSSLVAYIKRAFQPSLLKEAFKITIKNGKLVLLITFILFSYYSLKELADRFVLEPVLLNFVANSEFLPKNGSSMDSVPMAMYKPFLKDLRFILAYQFVIWSFLCVVLMFTVAASVHSTYEAHTAKVLGLKETLLGLRGKIKRPLKTTIWMIVICSAAAALLFFSLGVVAIMTEGSLLTNLNWTLIIFAALFYVYVFVLWMMSLVVSVLEENLSGLKAIYHANELMKGKRLKGFGLMVLLMLVSAAMHMMFSFLVSMAANKKAEMVVWAIVILRIWPYCLMKMFVFAVYTLFYHECKKSQEEEEIAYMYSPVKAVAEF